MYKKTGSEKKQKFLPHNRVLQECWENGSEPEGQLCKNREFRYMRTKLNNQTQRSQVLGFQCQENEFGQIQEPLINGGVYSGNAGSACCITVGGIVSESAFRLFFSFG